MEARSAPDDPLWSRALAPDPTSSMPGPRLDGALVVGGPEAPGPWEGTIYTDGSCLHPERDEWRRAGIGIAVYREGELRAWAHGPAWGFLQDIMVAELQAVIVALRNCLPPIVIVTDNKGVLDGWRAGEAWSVAANRCYSKVWADLWEKARDIGLENIIIRWVPSHTGKGDVQAGRISEADRVGNGKADEQARRGALMHPETTAVIEQWEETAAKVKLVGRWLGMSLAAASPWLGEEDAEKATDDRSGRARGAADAAAGHGLAAGVGAGRARGNGAGEQDGAEPQDSRGQEAVGVVQAELNVAGARPAPGSGHSASKRNGHELCEVPDGWRCKLCLKQCRQAKSIAVTPCPGAPRRA